MHPAVLLLQLSTTAMSAAPPDAAMLPTYKALAQHLLNRETSENAHWVCIAGGPGSGKSTLGAAVAQMVNEELGEERAVVLPMDGFHYSRAELRGAELLFHDALIEAKHFPLTALVNLPRNAQTWRMRPAWSEMHT